MSHSFHPFASLLIAGLLLVTGCAGEPDATMSNGHNGDGDSNGPGDGDGTGDGDQQPEGDSGSMHMETPPAGDLLPWREGNTWTYRVTNNGVVSMKTTVVGAEESVGGTGPNASKKAFKVTTTKGENDRTVSWQAVVGDRVVRYREQAFMQTSGALALEEHWAPHKIHVDGSDARTKAGASWTETFEETKTLPDGTATTATVSDSWIVDGVNVEVKVPAGTFRAVVLQKSGGSGSTKTYWYVPGIGKVKETGGQIEELVSYKVAP